MSKIKAHDRYQYENAAAAEGYKTVAGLDEAGRGSLAGPICVAICILPKNYRNDEINDSKLLSPSKREQLLPIIQKNAVYYDWELVDSKIVDQLNPKESTKQAMQQLIKRAKIKPDLCLIDAEIINAAVPTKAIIKGDQKSITIAAASIIAKVIRDQFMVAIDQQYPQYYFKEHKGYGTVKHLNALMQHGPINGFHRASYEPVKNIMLARKRKHHSKG